MQDVLNIGIDVAKAELVVGVVDHPQYNSTLANSAVHIKRWLRRIPPGSRIAVESTGPFHHLVVELAQAQGLTTYVLNARDVYYYAKGLGQRSKTDRTDAQLISHYLREHHAHLYPFKAGTLIEQQVNHLLRRRVLLVEQRDALKKSLQDVVNLEVLIQQLFAQFELLLAALDREMRTLLISDPQVASEYRSIQSVPGLGPQGAALLVCLFRRIGFTNADAVVAFSGLDPRAKDSGQKQGKRHLSKRGPALLRRQLFMAAFSACRTAVFKPTYQALRARGLSSTAALIILGRKLLRIAFAVWRTHTPFEASHYLANQACVKL